MTRIKEDIALVGAFIKAIFVGAQFLLALVVLAALVFAGYACVNTLAHSH